MSTVIYAVQNQAICDTKSDPLVRSEYVQPVYQNTGQDCKPIVQPSVFVYLSCDVSKHCARKFTFPNHANSIAIDEHALKTYPDTQNDIVVICCELLEMWKMLSTFSMKSGTRYCHTDICSQLQDSNCTLLLP